MDFSVTAFSVLTMLIYAVPGFIFIKSGKMKADVIPSFAILLMYVCQPCQTIYTFTSVDYSFELFINILLFMGITMAVMTVLLALYFVVFLKKAHEDVKYRIANVGAVFGNCSFMGVPLVAAVLPEYPEAKIYASVFAVGMNLIGWTLASAIISRNTKYISVKKMILNPSTIGLAIALPMFLMNLKFPGSFGDMVVLLGKMTTPLCMIIMGMRLATVKAKEFFCEKIQYFTIFMKQIVMPLVMLAVIQFLPIDEGMKKTLYILSATPVASVVLTYAELLGRGQKTAAKMLLMGTALSVITIPIMTMFYI